MDRGDESASAQPVAINQGPCGARDLLAKDVCCLPPVGRFRGFVDAGSLGIRDAWREQWVT